MTPPLPKALELVQSSVNDGIKQQKPLFQLNLLAFIVPLILGVVTSESVLANLASLPSGGGGIATFAGFLVGAIVMLVAVSWFSVHYLLRVLRLLKGDARPVTNDESRKLTPSYLWLGILQFLAIVAIPALCFIGAIFLGLGEALQAALVDVAMPSISARAGLGIFALFVVSIVSVIFLSVRLQFSSLGLVEDGKKGAAALKHAWSLSEGRFWSIAWRGLAFVLTTQIAAMLVGGIVGILGTSSAGTYVGMVITNAFNGFLLFPIAMFFQVRLYQAYRHESPAVAK